MSVVPSNALTASPIAVDGNFYKSLALIEKKTYGPDGLLTAYSPNSLLYLSVDSNSQTHINLLPLGNTSSVPASHQLSNFSWTSPPPPPTDLTVRYNSPLLVCPWYLMYEDLTDPDSAFLIFADSDDVTNICSPKSVQVAHVTDGASVPPVTVNISIYGPMAPIYTSSGKLGGIVAADNAGNLIFANSSFTSPVTLLPNVGYYQILNPVDPLTSTGSGAVMIAVATGNNNTTVYRIDSVGNIVMEYTIASITISNLWPNVPLSLSSTTDMNNAYFIVLNASTNTMSLYQAPLGAGTPTNLVSFSYSSSLVYFVVGSNGSALVYGVLDPQANTISYYSVPSGVQSANATLIVSVPSVNSVSGAASFGFNAPAAGITSAQLFLNEISTTTSTTAQSTMILKPDGTVVQALMANSSFRGLATRFSGTVLQLQGITDTDGYDGGGSLYDFNIVSGVTVPYSVVGTGMLTAPANGKSTIYAGGISNNLGTGQIVGNSSDMGFVYDVTTHTVIPVSTFYFSVIL